MPWVSEIMLTKIAPDRIEVLAYGKFDTDRIRTLLLAQGKLELAKVAGDTFQTYPTEEAAKQSMGGTVPANRRVLPYTDRADGLDRNRLWIVVENPPVVDGRTIRDASAYSPTGNDGYTINFQVKPRGR